MDTATRAALIAFTLNVAGGSLDDAWRLVDEAVAEHGAPTDTAGLRRTMRALELAAIS